MTGVPVIDLSHWQGVPDFGLVKGSGVEAVILKATQGSRWIDPTFSGRAVKAAMAGLLVGAYHFCDATDPVTQACHFLTVAVNAAAVLAIDIEPNGMGDTVTVAQAAEIAARIQIMAHRMPLIYIGRYGPDGKGTGLPNDVLSRCPLWLPEYEVTTPVVTAGWNRWTLWQYTDAGNCPGIPGVCDRSWYNGTADQLKAWWGS